MGLNGFFATVAKPCTANPTGAIGGAVCPGWGDTSLPWSDAMGAVFLSGWIYLFFTFTGTIVMYFTVLYDNLGYYLSQLHDLYKKAIYLSKSIIICISILFS